MRTTPSEDDSASKNDIIVIMGKIKIDVADKLFSKWIRLRDKQCVRCRSKVKFNSKGLPISHECSHFKGRGREATRFEPLNCDTLCYGCHAYLTAHPDKHIEFQVERKGQDVVDKIILQANSYKKKDRAAERKIWRERLWEDFHVKS